MEVDGAWQNKELMVGNNGGRWKESRVIHTEGGGGLRVTMMVRFEGEDDGDNGDDGDTRA